MTAGSIVGVLALPDDLTELDQWALHRSKRPYQVNGKPASSAAETGGGGK